MPLTFSLFSLYENHAHVPLYNNNYKYIYHWRKGNEHRIVKTKDYI